MLPAVQRYSRGAPVRQGLPVQLFAEFALNCFTLNQKRVEDRLIVNNVKLSTDASPRAKSMLYRMPLAPEGKLHQLRPIDPFSSFSRNS